MNWCGGYLNHYGDYSTAQIAAGLNYTYGGWADGNSPSDIENSKLVVLFGNNPGNPHERRRGDYFLEQAGEIQRQADYYRSTLYQHRRRTRRRADPYRPATDAALVSALAWVMINENLFHQPFLDKYCVGYDEKTLPEGRRPMATIRPIFSVRAKTVSRRPLSGRRRLPAFPRRVSCSWRAKSPALNLPIFLRAGAPAPCER
ncbi:molybdopterin-dependent oxidoreductase [Escherichia coli]